MYGFKKGERGNARFISCFKRGSTIPWRSRHRGARDFIFAGFKKGLRRAMLFRLWNSVPAAFTSPAYGGIAVTGFRKGLFVGKVRRQEALCSVCDKALLHGRINVRWNTMINGLNNLPWCVTYVLWIFFWENFLRRDVQCLLLCAQRRWDVFQKDAK